MIKVEVRLYADLRKYQPDLGIGEPLLLTLDDRAQLADLFAELQIPREEIKVVLVNGRWQEADYRLHDGDRAGIFSAIGGG